MPGSTGRAGPIPLRCAEALRRMAEMLGFREEAEALAGAAMALSGAGDAGSSLSPARFE